MLKKAIGVLLALTAGAFAVMAQDATAKEPVFILLYTRIYDHSHPFPQADRLLRLLPLLERLRKEHPESGISTLLEFSGTTSQLIADENEQDHILDRIKDAARRGLIQIGYMGEEEPSYINRPQPQLLLADTGEKRWTAYADAAEHFLVDFKDPVSGQPMPGLSGGLKRTQEIFGKVDYVTGISEPMSGDSAAVHMLRKMNASAAMMGIPASDLRRGIEGYGASANGLARMLTVEAETAPEVFWENGFLRVSDLAFNDAKPHLTEEGPDALKKAFAALDRKHVRVIRLELESYLRYLSQRPDGTVKWDPMEWLYTHPYHPTLPLTLKALADPVQIEMANRKEDATLQWLFNEFLPANPGSRFISIRELQQMAADPQGTQVSADELRLSAQDILASFGKMRMQTPNYVRAGNRFFSVAEAFELLAQGLAKEKAGSPAPAVKLSPMYGPLVIPNEMGLQKGSVVVRDVIQAAAELAPRLGNDAWKLVPDNAVPADVQVGQSRLDASQFLEIMADAYLDPTPDRTVPLHGVALFSTLGFLYPKNTLMLDQGNTWTVKPAPLHISAPANKQAAGDAF